VERWSPPTQEGTTVSGALQEPADRDDHGGDPALPDGVPLRPERSWTVAPLDVRTGTTPAGARVLAVAGEVDLATAPQLDAALAGLLSADRARVVLDLSEVTFLASRGIAVLIDAHERALDRGVELHLVVTRPQVHRILEMTGLLAVLPWHATRADADAP
jgi:anti-anti-sigma factor